MRRIWMAVAVWLLVGLVGTSAWAEDGRIVDVAVGRRGILVLLTADGRLCIGTGSQGCQVLAEGFRNPCCLAVAPCGDIVVGWGGGRIDRVDRRGIRRTLCSNLTGLRALAVDRDGQVLAAAGPAGGLRVLSGPQSVR